MDSRLTAILLVSFFCLIALRKFAIAVNLVDLPSERKHHQGSVPLVGGLAIFFTVALFLLLTPNLGSNTVLYLLFAAILIATGALDDKFDISVKARLIIQLIITLMMFSAGDIQLTSLGNILSWGNITFTNAFAIIVTFLAVAGAINAFNMVDGIDGLLGGLSVITFSSMAYLFNLGGQSDLYQLSLLIVFATLPYLLLNLGFPFGRRLKIFMGDAGSMFVGFTVVWLLLSGSQSEVSSFRPVTALWLIALPLMDMAAIMIRRIRKGQSPFRPDREHLHHICQRMGLSSKMTLLAICTIAIGFACIGIVGEINNISESVMFFSFVLMFASYYAVICHIWRVTSFIRKVSTLLSFSKGTPTVSDGEQR